MLERLVTVHTLEDEANENFARHEYDMHACRSRRIRPGCDGVLGAYLRVGVYEVCDTMHGRRLRFSNADRDYLSRM